MRIWAPLSKCIFLRFFFGSLEQSWLGKISIEVDDILEFIYWHGYATFAMGSDAIR